MGTALDDERSREVSLAELPGPSHTYYRPSGSPPSDGEGIDLGALWSIVRSEWRLVVGVAAGVFFLVMGITLMMHMEFTASGRLYLGELDQRGRAGGSGELDLAGGGQSDVSSEMEIIKSRSIVAEAISSAGLNASIERVGWNAPRFWEWLLSKRDSKLMEGAAQEIAVVAAALPDDAQELQSFRIVFVSPERYDVYIQNERIAQGELGRPFTASLGSFTLRAGDRGPLSPGASYDLSITPLDDEVTSAINKLTVTAPKVGTGSGDLVRVVTLEFVNRSARKAAVFLKSLMATYLGRRQSWKTEDASAAESFVSHQLVGMRDSLDDTEKKLAEYRSNTRVVVLDNEAQAMIEQVGKYEEQRVAARLHVAALSEIKRILKHPNPPAEAYLLGEAGDSVLEGLGRTLAESRRQLTELEGRFHAAAPDVQNQKAQIAAQLETIRSYVTNRLTRAQENLNTLNGIIQQFEEKLKTVPGAELGLAQLARESDVYSKLYSYLLERQQQAAIQKASTVSKNRILDAPSIPRRESAPVLGLRLASGVLGLMLGVFCVFMKRFFGTRLQSELEIQAIAGVPIVASIPRISRRDAVGAPFRSLADQPNSSFAEAFRGLRTSLYQLGRDRDARVLLVTSPAPGDGKTTTVLSLAAMLAADGKWVLVVDADLRKPSHHLIVREPEGEGLRGVLSGQCSWRDVVHPVPVAMGEFFALSAGGSGPAEQLTGERMTRFLMEARSCYDFVLIDAPSFPLVADPLALAPLTDGILSIMRVGHTPRKVALTHLKRLGRTSRDLSVVVNGSEATAAYGDKPQAGGLARVWPLSALREKKSKLAI